MDLREFKKTETDRGVGLTCPRSDCGAKFVVNYGQTLDRKLKGVRHPVATIVCPTCSRVSAIPAEDVMAYGHLPCRHTRAGREARS